MKCKPWCHLQNEESIHVTRVLLIFFRRGGLGEREGVAYMMGQFMKEGEPQMKKW